MKYAATLALVLNVGLASVYAQQAPVNVRMTFSGNGAASPINLNVPNTSTGEENVAGNSTLGPFTFRNVTAHANSPQPSSTCSGPTKLFFPRVAGAGIFRFQDKDGSLLKVILKEGGDCIDLEAGEGHCTLSLKIAGGTGRFKSASGDLTFTETGQPVLPDPTVLFFTEVGELTGTISGVAAEEEPQGVHQ